MIKPETELSESWRELNDALDPVGLSFVMYAVTSVVPSVLSCPTTMVTLSSLFGGGPPMLGPANAAIVIAKKKKTIFRKLFI
jgi:hypothetical protein